MNSSTQPSARTMSVLPTRDEMVDALFLVGLGALALLGFHSAYGGQSYLVVGVVAMVAGLALAHLGIRARQPFVVVAVLAVVLAVLLGAGVALRDTAIAGVLPSLTTVSSLGHAVIYGWKELLTTVRPVDSNTGDLLALPYLLGLSVAVLSYTLARRVRPLAAPLLPVLAVAALSILFGTPKPTAAFAQGALLAGVALAWLALRHARVGTSHVRSSGRLGRPAMALGMIALAVPAAWALGPHLPEAQAHARVVIRVEPPFDPGQYPSPLAAFRRYVPGTPRTLASTPLFTVSGLPAGTPVRVAILDAYDGLAWGASNAADGQGDLPAYARIGSTLPVTAAGAMTTATVALSQSWDQVWLPTVGEVSGIRFTGPRAADLADSVRFSLRTESGIVPAGLTAGDGYELKVSVPHALSASELASAQPEGAPDLDGSVSAALRPIASTLSKGQTAPVAQVLASADYLKTTGRYSNGNDTSQAEPGHGLGRLLSFLQAKQIAGDDEQYAAAMALLAQTEGVPARVVLGSVLPASGVVTGNDVSAWVELDLAGHGWTRLATDAFTPNRDKKPDPQPKVIPPKPAPAYVPPPIQKPITTAVSAGQADTSARDQARQKSIKAAAGLPAWVATVVKVVGIPVAALLLFAAFVTAIKFARRRRRRTRGTPAQRVAGGWAELLDTAADQGTPAVRAGTRREQARGLATLPLREAAVGADAVVFGPDELDEQVALTYWQQVDLTRKAMVTGLSGRQRLRHALSLRSLRPSRRFATVPQELVSA